MDAGRLLGHEELLADLAVGRPRGDQRQHLELARGETEGRVLGLGLGLGVARPLDAEPGARGEAVDLAGEPARAEALRDWRRPRRARAGGVAVGAPERRLRLAPARDRGRIGALELAPRPRRRRSTAPGRPRPRPGRARPRRRRAAPPRPGVPRPPPPPRGPARAASRARSTRRAPRRRVAEVAGADGDLGLDREPGVGDERDPDPVLAAELDPVDAAIGGRPAPARGRPRGSRARPAAPRAGR